MPRGWSWAKECWQSPVTVVERTGDLTKAVICLVLGAALVAAQRDKHTVKRTDREASESLQEFVETLQAELEVERKKWRVAEWALVDERQITANLQHSLQDAFIRERELRQQFTEDDLKTHPGFFSPAQETNPLVQDATDHYP